jgi:hypothetical protein
LMNHHLSFPTRQHTSTSQQLLSTNPTSFEQRGIAQRKTPTPKMVWVTSAMSKLCCRCSIHVGMAAGITG